LNIDKYDYEVEFEFDRKRLGSNFEKIIFTDIYLVLIYQGFLSIFKINIGDLLYDITSDCINKSFLTDINRRFCKIK
jgi:hypothetical protein